MLLNFSGLFGSSITDSSLYLFMFTTRRWSHHGGKGQQMPFQSLRWSKSLLKDDLALKSVILRAGMSCQCSYQDETEMHGGWPNDSEPVHVIGVVACVGIKLCIFWPALLGGSRDTEPNLWLALIILWLPVKNKVPPAFRCSTYLLSLTSNVDNI